LADHVLSRFGGDEQDMVEEAIDRAAQAAELFIAEGVEAAMNRFNARDDKVSDEETR
jgi:PTH1 family peptidyl-tRNA hydrolase